MRHVLGSRASIGCVLGSGRGSAAAQWWLSGGVSAANAIAVYQPIGAASLAASYTNLANPGTYTAAPGVAPTWAAATGWTGNNPTNVHITTGILLGSGWSVIVRFSNVVDGNNLYGSITNSAGKYYFIDSLTSTPRYANGGILSTGTSYTSGVAAVAGNTAYKNGVAQSGTMASALPATVPLVILARNVEGTINSATSSRIQAFAIYDTTLSAAQVAAISSAMAALTG